MATPDSLTGRRAQPLPGHVAAIVFLAVALSGLILVSPILTIGTLAILIIASIAFFYPSHYVVLLFLLVPFNNLIMISTGYLDIRLLKILWPFALVSLLRHPPSNALPRQIARTNVFLILFPASALLSASLSNMPFVAWRDALQFSYLAGIPVLATLILAGQKLPRKAGAAVGILVALMGIDGIIKFLTGQSIIPRLEIDLPSGSMLLTHQALSIQEATFSFQSFPRLDVFSGGPVATASLTVILVSLLLPTTLLAETPVVTRKRLSQWGSLAILCSLLVLTYSRTAIVIFFFAIPLLFTLFMRRRSTILLLIASLLLFLILLPVFGERLSEIGTDSEGSNVVHYGLWFAALDQWRSNPIFGVGPGVLPSLMPHIAATKSRIINLEGTDTHNMLLQVLAETGILGFLTFSSLLATFLYRLARMHHHSSDTHRYLALACLIATSTMILMNLTMNGFHKEQFWTVLALDLLLLVRHSISQDDQLQRGTLIGCVNRTRAM